MSESKRHIKYPIENKWEQKKKKKSKDYHKKSERRNFKQNLRSSW